jgi:hypothetical protein
VCLDSSPERAYDDITRLLATELAVPITMVNLLDEERDWFKACFGVQQTQSPAVTSFCEMFFTSNSDLIVVNDTLFDEHLAQHPLVVGLCSAVTRSGVAPLGRAQRDCPP